MKTLTSLTAALATLLIGALLPSVLRAQDERTHNLSTACHFLGKWAEQAATARRVGIPVSNMLDVVHDPVKTARMPPADRKMFAVLAAELERITLAVYASDLSPNNAYLTYRAQCQAVAAGR